VQRPSWSFSSVEQYRNCPKQYQEIRVLKNWKEPETEERLWGNRVHDALKECLQHGTPLPAGMEVWQNIADQFRGVKGVLMAEQQIALDENWQQCRWFDKRAWLRVILDAAWVHGTVGKVIDWKTGKPKYGSDQLALFALVMFAIYPQLTEVRTAYVWLKTGQLGKTEVYKREDIPKLWEMYSTDLQRIENSHANGVFPPRTSCLCHKHCPVVTCTFNGRRRQENK